MTLIPVAERLVVELFTVSICRGLDLNTLCSPCALIHCPTKAVLIFSDKGCISTFAFSRKNTGTLDVQGSECS